MRPSKWTGFILLKFMTAFVACLLVIPERGDIEYQNPKYVTDAKHTVVRYGRRSKYYFNIVGTTLHTWGNNVTANFVFYEYLHNEYRRSFVEMHFKLCEMLNDQYIGKLFKNAGLKCPLPPGHHEFLNMTVPTENFTMVWPFKRARVDTEILTSTGDTMCIAHLYLHFVDEKRKPGRFMGQ